MLINSSKRSSQRVLAVEFNPFQILVAELARPVRGSAVLESAAEFNADDTEGFRRWIETKINGKRSRTTTICGLVPHRGIVQRETLQPARLAEPGYLESVAEEQQRGRFLSATPFKIINPATWTLRAISAVDGTALPVSGPSRPALICAIANDEMIAAQRRLSSCNLTRERLEPGLLSLFGAVYSNMELRDGPRAVVVVVIHQSATAAYILGKEGVHTPNPVLHGLDSIVEAAQKELGEPDDAEVMFQLQTGNPDLVKHGAKLVRRIGRDLKPVVDSFEMTTGQPVDEILCAYLPPQLSWLAEPLARATGRTPLALDLPGWFSSVGLQVAESGPVFGPHWLGALSLVANLPEGARRTRNARASKNHSYHRPWHVDCSVPIETDEHKFTGRRFLKGAIAATLAAVVVAFTAWQLYATYSLKADTRYWEQQLEGNRKLFDQLNASQAKLKERTAILDRAYEMMSESHPLTHLFLDLGRTIPARMRVDRIDVNDSRVTVSGEVLEPAEEAATTLGRHMDDIRRHAELGPLFSNIAITSLQRKINSDAVVFELTLRFKRPSP